MGSGKSTVGPLLATRLGVDFLDNDTRLFDRTRRSARQIEAADGLPALHRFEAEALLSALAGPPAVIAAAAGAVLEPDVVAALAAQDVVYLRVPPEVAQARVRDPADGHRPDLDAAALFEARDPRYVELATVVVNADQPPAAIVDDIIRALAQ